MAVPIQSLCSNEGISFILRLMVSAESDCPRLWLHGPFHPGECADAKWAGPPDFPL